MAATKNQGTSARPIVLCILDGWGLRRERQDNAIALAATPNWDRMLASWPTGTLRCSGEDVGLPSGQMGNSEVGHLNIGAGRVVWQDLPRINRAIAEDQLRQSSELVAFADKLRASGGTCHLVGLVSPGGVHAHEDHIVALAKAVSERGVPVRIHAITDGRDTPPNSGRDCLARLQASIAEFRDVSIATVCGRYFAMDRDKRWERVARAYDLLVSAKGDAFDDALDVIAASYAQGTTDEFVTPARHTSYNGMGDGDGILCANFRADRVRQLLAAILDPDFDGFARTSIVDLGAALGMVAYSDHISQFCPAIFAPTHLENTLGDVVANAGLRQLRAAETEKYPHVTYFFNGGVEPPLAGEERILVPSPKVATYDLKPEMSAVELTNKVIAAIETQRFDLVVINYANGDMVGHTGVLDAAVRAVACVDMCIGRLEQVVKSAGGAMLVTADHGNCELMFDRALGAPHTAHTLNLVPTILVNGSEGCVSLANGRLADIAPTLLDLLGIEQPPEMTGASLLNPSADAHST
ncbi:MAG: 2,3-bisphosphoglycerate-independent phosphoglycerate mutase [Pseudomonadota bacterium]